MEGRELSFFRLYLKKYLTDTENPLKDDDEFINARADEAEIEFEERRRDGLTVDQAQELAMATLMHDT
ncbi:MAG: DUF1896 family protein [Prevotella sp.]|nr:DUF1896 family protein [Prevotella sp.]